MRSYPSCTVTVYNTGTAVLTTLYSNDLGTPLANPFTASLTGYWFFYADNARFDVTLSGGGIPVAFTLGDIPLGGLLSLNGLTGGTQTFTNDTNVTITSGGSAHVLGWAGTLGVTRGGTGAATLAANGVLLGSGVAPMAVTAAGAAYQPLRVPAGGGAPAFGALDISQAAAVTGALAIANGGTGQATQTLGFNALSPTTNKGDLVADDGTNAVRLGVGADNLALLADVAQATGLKWGQVPLASGVSGTLPLANGGTGQTTKTAAMDGLSPTTTKGDVLVDNGTNVVRQGIGVDNYLLMADAAQANGLKWAQITLSTSSVIGTLPVARGGTNLAVGTSGGVLGYTAVGVLASSAALGANQLVLGGGAGATPTSLGALGTATTLLHGNAAGAPSFGAVALAADVAGVLPVANGGTGIAAGTSGGVLGYTAAGTIASSAALTANQLVLGGGAGVTPGPLGSLGTVTTVLHGNAGGAPNFGAVALAADVSGTLPIANGGTGGATKLAAFDALSPTTNKGDLIVDDGANDVRRGVGANGTVLTADNAEATGIKWAASPYACTKYNVTFANAAFIAAATTADVALFVATQYLKLNGATAKHSVIFSDAGGAMTEVTVSLGYAGAPTFYTSPANIGEATAVADTTFQDTSIFRSGTMAAAGQTVLARFTATGANFGNGAATNLVSGNVDLWVCSTTLP
jgi:hypothetical protein